MQLLLEIADILSALAITALSVLTYFSVKSSLAMAAEARESRLVQTLPIVHPQLKAKSGGPLRIVFRNIGPGPALDVALTWEGMASGSGHADFMAPGEEITYDLQIAGKTSPRLLSITARFRDLFGNWAEVSSRYRVVFGQNGPEVAFVDTKYANRAGLSG